MARKRARSTPGIEKTLPEPIEERTSSDDFALLNFDEDGVVWASAFVNGDCVASLPIDQGQREVEFITPLTGITRQSATVSFAVVDDLTSQPIAGA